MKTYGPYCSLINKNMNGHDFVVVGEKPSEQRNSWLPVQNKQ